MDPETLRFELSTLCLFQFEFPLMSRQLLFLTNSVNLNFLQISISINSSKKFGLTELIKTRSSAFRHFFCMQNLKPSNLEFFVRPNSKCNVVDYPMIMLA